MDGGAAAPASSPTPNIRRKVKGPLADLPEQLAAIDALYNSTSRLLHASQKDRRSVERQVVWKMGQPRVHPAIMNSLLNGGGRSLAGGMGSASRESRRRARNLIAENILTQGRPRGQLLRVLRQIDGQIDAPLKKRLRDGSIRLLRCSWLMNELNLKQHLKSEGSEGGAASSSAPFVMKRRQDLPEEAFFDPEEAALLLSRGDRSVLALSYGWLTQIHPDPHGTTLATLLRYMHEATPSVEDCGLFWDYVSVFIARTHVQPAHVCMHILNQLLWAPLWRLCLPFAGVAPSSR